MVDDESDDTTETDEKDEQEEWTPPTKEEVEKLRTELGRTREEAKQYRLKLKAQRDAAANGSARGVGSTPPASAAPAAIDLEAERAKWQAETDRRIIGERARTALAAAGLVIPDGQNADTVISRAVKLLDLDSLALTDSGSVSGLDAELDTLKASYPGMFKIARRAGAGVDGGTAGRAGATSSATTGKKTNTAARLAARWANGGQD